MGAGTDFGTRLRQAREARGVSLRSIAAATKISLVSLEALEHNDVSRLPGGIFSRSFVRSYAIEVGLDPEATVRAFLERFPDDVNPIRDVAKVTEQRRPDSSNRVLGVLAAAAVLILAGASAIGLLWWSGTLPWNETTASSSPIAAAPLPVTPAPATALAAQSPAHSETTVEATTDDAAALPGAEDAAVAGNPSVEPVASRDIAIVANLDTLRLDVQPTARCWVRIVADGQVVFSREMAAGERETREARGSFLVTVGNAGAFSYSINDVPGRTLGGDGKVVTVRIDHATLPDFVAS